MTGKIIEGKLLLYSETGMEGGYLSMQDKNFITISTPTFGVVNDRKVYDKNNPSKQGISSNAHVYFENNWVEYPDPICNEADYKISSLFCGELNGDLEADQRLSKKYNFKIKYFVDRLNDLYGQGNWEIDKKLPNIILKNGTQLQLGVTPTTIPSRPYGIPQGGKTRVTVTWNDGSIQHEIFSDDLMIEQSDFKGLHMLKNEDVLKIIDPTTKNIICEGQINKIPLNVFSQTKKGHFVQAKLNDNCNWEQYFSENYFAELHRQ